MSYNVGLAYASAATAHRSSPSLRLGDGSVVSHGELNTLANRLAALLADRGLRHGNVLAIVHDKSALCYAAMLAALKLGAPYVNIDDQNPTARLRHIFDSAKPSLVVGERLPRAVAEGAHSLGIALLDLQDPQLEDDLRHASAAEPPAATRVVGTDPAYIMYTSGSTGLPKGALITHAAVLNFGAWARSRFAIEPADVLSNVNPMYFDNSVFDFYASLLNGASMSVVSRDTVAKPLEMIAQLERARCTIWFSVPSLLMYLTTLKALTASTFPDLRTFVFGGEGYPKPELSKLFALFGSRVRLVNVYGPTECTCICSAWDVGAADLADPAGLVTLGPVADNFDMLVLDEDDHPVTPGAVGELCLLGPQVGLGYMNDAERTARAFVQNPTHAGWPDRMYRTGDLVRLADDGRRLDFVGRRDNQIKHMGYRIELEEIEAALNQVAGVLQSAVLHRAGKRGRKALVAFVAAAAPLSEQHLRAELAKLLPPYMIPQQFDVRTTLPKNANGKVDRLALATLG